MATAEEMKAASVGKMGEALGGLYHALWQSLAHLYGNWNEYAELFGTKPSRIGLMNRAASSFFGMLQNELWNLTLLHMARLTDSPRSVGRPNLSIRALPDLITDATLKAEVEGLVALALTQTEFCRDWRNRLLAHADLDLALEVPSRPLSDASRRHVNDGLAALTNVLNVLDKHFNDSETQFHFHSPVGGALELLYTLDEGVRAKEARMKRIESGQYIAEDLEPHDV
jgi:hypothetical protein